MESVQWVKPLLLPEIKHMRTDVDAKIPVLSSRKAKVGTRHTYCVWQRKMKAEEKMRTAGSVLNY